MKRSLLATLLFVVMLMAPLAVFAEQPPEMIFEKIELKFARGLGNMITSPLEFPKQIIKTGEEMGPVGYLLIGPLKGIGMTLYRGFIGAVETTFCGVPQPGYYDPMMEPAYVWEGWESKHDSQEAAQ
jgi:putative exosortase-associated protein (TIGR04073 family)